jgi:hypothetical protein
MDDCIAVLGCTYIGGGGPPMGGTQEAPEEGRRTREAPLNPNPTRGAQAHIQVGAQAQHGSCIQAAKYNSNKG